MSPCRFQRGITRSVEPNSPAEPARSGSSARLAVGLDGLLDAGPEHLLQERTRARGSAGCSRRSAPARTAGTAAAPPSARGRGSRSDCPAAPSPACEIQPARRILPMQLTKHCGCRPCSIFGIAGDALLRRAGHRVEEDLLVRAGLRRTPVAAAAALVDQHDAVLGPLVDRAARAGGQAGRIGAVVADPRQVEEPGQVRHLQVGAAARPAPAQSSSPTFG